MQKNAKGFSVVEGLLIVLVVAVVGFIGYYVWHSHITKPQTKPLTSCISQGIDLASPYSYSGMKVATTMGQELISIGAHCNNSNVLVDSTNHKIDIEDSFGCWGNLPADYQGLQQQEAQKIQNLKKTYTVLIPQCNPGIV